MVGGWDHLLFIAGEVLLAGNWRTAAKLISLFVLGHSLTLLIATLAGWELNATVVDVVIALSLVHIGVLGWLGRPENLRLVGATVFGFGLIHGLGLSTRLQDLGLPDSGLVERILLFNVGVELGQLAALAVIVGAGVALTRMTQLPPETRRAAFAGIAAVGFVAAAVLSFPGTDTEDADEPAETLSSACTKGTTTQPSGPVQGGHPDKPFFGPEEEAPTVDLNHVRADGYVIVYYRPNLSGEDLEELEAWILSEQPSFVVAAAKGDQAQPIEVFTREQKLTCSEFSIDDLTIFRDEWFDTLRSRQGQ